MRTCSQDGRSGVQGVSKGCLRGAPEDPNVAPAVSNVAHGAITVAAGVSQGAQGVAKGAQAVFKIAQRVSMVCPGRQGGVWAAVFDASKYAFMEFRGLL